jgi:SnoaL-like domain
MKMKTKNDTTTPENNPKEIVLTFINAMNMEDFKTARSCVADDLVFDGILGQREGADAYFQDMKKMRLKYKIIKTFEDDDNACLLCDVSMSGITMFTCIWYQLQGGKIKLIKVVFDPRPALEQSAKK